MNAWDQTKGQLLEEIRILRSRNAKLERINHEMSGPRDAQLRPHTDRAQFQSFVQTAPSVVLCLDREYRILEFNPEAERLYGRKRADVLGKDYLELFLPDNAREAVAADIEKVLAGVPTREFENTVMTKDKQERILRWNVGRILDFEDKPAGVIAFGQDITERKQAEEALKESEERFRSLSNAAFEGIAITEQGKIVDANATFTDLFGYHFDEIIGKEVEILVVPENRKLVVERIQSGYEKPYEHKALRKDGSVLDIEVCGRSVLYKGRECRITAIRDITDRKRAEETLQKTTKELQVILDSVPAGIWYKDTGNRLLRVNKAGAESIGMKVEDIEGKVVSDIFPEDAEHYYEDDLEVIKSGKSKLGIVERMQVLGGEKKWVQTDKVLYWDEQGNVAGVIAFVQDVTERKQAEEALRESEQLLRSITSAAKDAIVMADNLGNISYWNPAAENIFGYQKDEVIGESLIGTVFSESSADASKERLEQFGKTGTDPAVGKTSEMQAKRKDGTEFPMEVSLSRVKIRDQWYSVGIMRDITKRKRAEEHLRQESQMRSTLLDNLPCIAMILKKGTREIVASNENARKVGAVPGKTCYETCAQRDDNCPWCLAPEVWATDESRRIEVEYRGTYYEGIWVPLTEDLYVHYIFDITERKEAEKTLITYQNDLKSLASKLTSTEEFQRRQIAADLHDNVSQTLALSVNQLRRLRKSAASGDAKTLDEVCQMIEKSMQNIQDLTFDLASPTLYKIGLEAAISELLNEQLRDRHGITCKFSDDKKDKPLDDNIRVLLFQAVRELLVNVIKHAKAHEVEVAIQRGNDKIQISVSDDGIGFDIQEAETSIERSGGFGLFNIRERIDYINGSFEIHSQPGCGSRFILTAPMKNKTNLSPERYDGS